MRLAILCSHPIQYYVPIFRLLAQQNGIAVRVFYGQRGASDAAAFDEGFGRAFRWDIPLLDGYDWETLPNVSKKPSSTRFGGIIVRNIGRRIEQWKPDALLVYGWNFRAHLAAMRYFSKRIPVLFRGDSTLLGQRGWWRTKARSLYLRWVYSHVDVALYVGTRNRDYYSASGLSSDQLVFAPHSVDNDRFLDLEGTRELEAKRWRQELGVAADACVTLFVGKLEPIKQPLLLLDAFKSVANSKSILIFCGSGECERELRRRSDERIRFIGFQNQSRMPVVYRLGNLFVLPSISETWGLVVNEAMASARAVLASDQVGSAIDLVEPVINGDVFRAESMEDLQAKLGSLLAKRASLRIMGLAANEKVKSWSNQRQVDGILEGLKRAYA